MIFRGPKYCIPGRPNFAGDISPVSPAPAVLTPMCIAHHAVPLMPGSHFSAPVWRKARRRRIKARNAGFLGCGETGLGEFEYKKVASGDGILGM